MDEREVRYPFQLGYLEAGIKSAAAVLKGFGSPHARELARQLEELPGEAERAARIHADRCTTTKGGPA